MYKNILMSSNIDNNNNNNYQSNNILDDNNTNYLITKLNLYNKNRWLDEKIDITRYFNNIEYYTEVNLYISKYNNITFYYFPTDYEIYQKHYYHELNYQNIYKHPSKKVLKEDENAVILVGLNHKTRRFYLDNIFRKIIDICITNNIRDPITNEYLINKSHRDDFYKWSKNNS